MKKLFRYFRVKSIDILVYSMKQPTFAAFPEIPYELKSAQVEGKTKFYMEDNGKFVHCSWLFPKLNVLKIIGKSGPAIGECVTATDYRGKSIYPYVINRIANELLAGKKASEVFIIVNSDNTASINGIEKAGFTLEAKVTAKRFLLFYFGKEITRI
jgi:predicted acetyltransferase